MAKVLIRPKKEKIDKEKIAENRQNFAEIRENFAIIKAGGKQYKVNVGDIVKIEKVKAEKTIAFDDLYAGKKVSASIVSEGRYPKVKIFKFKPKKRYQRTRGHVQKYTLIKIESIKE